VRVDVKAHRRPRMAGEQVKRLVEPLISFARHPFGPGDAADDPDYLELRDRVLRNHGIWAPPGSSYRIGDLSELERPSNPPARGGNYE
jgi:hypothetical protein